MAKIFHQCEKNFHYPYDLVVDSTHKSPFANAKKILELIKQNVVMPKTYYIIHKEIDRLKTTGEIDYWLGRYSKCDDRYWSNRK